MISNAFVTSDEFARSIRTTDNYYVIVSREGLSNLPYSIEEIYGIRNTGKYGGLKQVYNAFYRIYGRDRLTNDITPEVLITEDKSVSRCFLISAVFAFHYNPAKHCKSSASFLLCIQYCLPHFSRNPMHIQGSLILSTRKPR